LQNENGPCPLIATVNCLLLDGTAVLPANSVASQQASLAVVVDVLANHALTVLSTESSYYVQEVMDYLPTFQYGLDTNPHLLDGTFEYTAQQLAAFEATGLPVVHGWMVDPDDTELTRIVTQSPTYNQCMERLVRAQTKEDIDAQEQADCQKLQQFLESSAHQLTPTGLWHLHTTVDTAAVLFRNNHFATVVKHLECLYVLVTDAGYADQPGVVWERLDVIDGDTEYTNAHFESHAPAYDAVDRQAARAAAEQEAINQATQASLQGMVVAETAVLTDGPTKGVSSNDNEVALSPPHTGDEALARQLQQAEESSDAALARQLQQAEESYTGNEDGGDAALARQLQQAEASYHGNGGGDLELARQLQRAEQQRARSPPQSSKANGCVIS